MSFPSNDTIPAGALVEPLDYSLDGDFSACPYDGYVTFAVGGGSLFALTAHGQQVTAIGTDVHLVQAAAPVTVNMYCSGGMMGGAPLPTFDASITFQWTVRDMTPTRPFN